MKVADLVWIDTNEGPAGRAHKWTKSVRGCVIWHYSFGRIVAYRMGSPQLWSPKNKSSLEFEDLLELQCWLNTLEHSEVPTG